MIPLPRASEYEADKAIAAIEKVINAAENSNQAGEDIVALMARAPQLYRRMVILEEALTRLVEMAAFEAGTVNPGQPFWDAIASARAALVTPIT